LRAPSKTLEALRSAGITHVVGIPDNTSGPLFDVLASVEGAPPRLVMVTREGEAFAIASGLWMGGASPLVVVQNTGFLESGDSIRGTALRMGAPIPVVITGRGYAKMEREGLQPDAPRTTELLTRPDVDSVALFTEPTLDAWGIPYAAAGPEEDRVDGISSTIERAQRAGRTVALVLTRALD